MDAVSAIVFEDVECDRVFEIGGIEINHVPASRRRQMIEDFLGEVAMGINETDAFAGRDIPSGAARPRAAESRELVVSIP